jgi:hypothetical protein
MSCFGHEMLYKRMLDDATVEEASAQLRASGAWNRIDGGLAPFRLRTEECVFEPGTSAELRAQIETGLSPYLGEMVLGDFRVYVQEFGGIRPHLDTVQSEVCASYPNRFTLLIYLTDDFEGGRLRVKCPRGEADPEPEKEPQKRHRVLSPEPRRGYGVLFSKDYPHWADDVFGAKVILLTDVGSQFSLK